MLVSAFATFVRDSDQSIGKPHATRLDIATYGLTAEIGSVVAAVKKRLLAEDGFHAWNAPNAEIVEELGDVLWYGFSLAALANPDKPVNIFAHDISNLRREIGANDQRADQIRRVLIPAKREEFMKAAATFPTRTKSMMLEHYQRLAFLTARTEERTLVEVCLAVLLQLGAQLFRSKLPQVERELNTSLVDRHINDVLGEIAWHVAALASIFKLSLSEIAQKNIDKVSYRLVGSPTPLHDEECRASQQFPRQFAISFITVGRGRSRMYLDGRRLGDDLTDNSYNDDGYRFHDIMHLANVAKLGWSPVLRGLMGRKRKQFPTVDEVEDGARARIVEEAVVKAIHSEGQRIAGLYGPQQPGVPQRLFSSKSDITFRFLKFIRDFVVDLEVHKNRYWEWEAAIVAGYEIFYALQCAGQGTVFVDMDARTIRFEPEVFVAIVGKVAGLGSAFINCGGMTGDPSKNPPFSGPQGAEVKAGREQVQSLAILNALDLQPTPTHLAALTITEAAQGGISVKASGSAQHAMWAKSIVSFRTTVVELGAGTLQCTAVGISDE